MLITCYGLRVNKQYCCLVPENHIPHSFLCTYRENYTASGKPYSGILSGKELELCDMSGIIPPSAEVLYYPQLLLPHHTITSATRARTTKRSNSCVMLNNLHQQVCWGVLVECIFSFKNNNKPAYYCLVTLLFLSPNPICTDTITNAKLQDHLLTCMPPRYASVLSFLTMHSAFVVFLALN